MWLLYTRRICRFFLSGEYIVYIKMRHSNNITSCVCKLFHYYDDNLIKHLMMMIESNFKLKNGVFKHKDRCSKTLAWFKRKVKNRRKIETNWDKLLVENKNTNKCKINSNSTI